MMTVTLLQNTCFLLFRNMFPIMVLALLEQTDDRSLTDVQTSLKWLNDTDFGLSWS